MSYVPPALRKKANGDTKDIRMAEETHVKDRFIPSTPTASKTVENEATPSQKSSTNAKNGVDCGKSDDLEASFGRMAISSQKIPKPINGRQRPETNALVANRMVAHALGIPITRSPDREAKDRQALERARDIKAKAKRDLKVSSSRLESKLPDTKDSN